MCMSFVSASSVDMAKSELLFDGQLLFTEDFQGDKLAPWQKKLLANKDSLILIPDPEDKTNRVAKFSLDRNDPYVNDSKRAELLWGGIGQIGNNKEYCYGFRNYLPSDWQQDPGYDVIAQWKTKNDASEKALGVSKSPALALRIENDKFFITNRWDQRVTTTPNHSDQHTVLWQGQLKKGTWVKWKICAVWSYLEAGQLRIWQDDTLIVDKTGPNAHNDPKSMKVKYGIYKPPWKATKGTPVYSSTNHRVVFFDDIWMSLLPQKNSH